jgi:hypothetical protein
VTSRINAEKGFMVILVVLSKPGKSAKSMA